MLGLRLHGKVYHRKKVENRCRDTSCFIFIKSIKMDESTMWMKKLKPKNRECTSEFSVYTAGFGTTDIPLYQQANGVVLIIYVKIDCQNTTNQKLEFHSFRQLNFC